MCWRQSFVLLNATLPNLVTYVIMNIFSPYYSQLKLQLSDINFICIFSQCLDFVCRAKIITFIQGNHCNTANQIKTAILQYKHSDKMCPTLQGLYISVLISCCGFPRLSGQKEWPLASNHQWTFRFSFMTDNKMSIKTSFWVFGASVSSFSNCR